MNYLIYGAGGHAKVVADIIYANGDYVIGVVDDSFRGDTWRGIPFYGHWDNVAKVVLEHPDAQWIIAIGNNQVRKTIVEKMNAFSVKWGKVLHPSTIISPSVQLGEGSVCMPGVIINADSIIGKHVILNTATTVDHDNKILDYVHLSPGVHTAGSVTINELSHIGIGTNIIPGITIGKQVIIGASACVVKDIPNDSLALGCPAKVIDNLSKG
ncbi:acetyltransferase [Paenibacillus hunanensis]|uniref:acetyltransferase n=1 Tax=Paenibacillus hunanensis TaxID=539262 RepID=UPI002025B690|nr:acetyltransferase [Paenibacillus hunanensis]MCL9662789.1 acetyltransferase [Paenibacillus hunanensis]